MKVGLLTGAGLDVLGAEGAEGQIQIDFFQTSRSDMSGGIPALYARLLHLFVIFLLLHILPLITFPSKPIHF